MFLFFQADVLGLGLAVLAAVWPVNVGMKAFDEDALRPHLREVLQPVSLTEPAVLADYVIALLKNDGSREELTSLFEEDLQPFLEGHTKVTDFVLMQRSDECFFVFSQSCCCCPHAFSCSTQTPRS